MKQILAYVLPPILEKGVLVIEAQVQRLITKIRMKAKMQDRSF
jgi:hypothetical protein